MSLNLILSFLIRKTFELIHLMRLWISSVQRARMKSATKFIKRQYLQEITINMQKMQSLVIAFLSNFLTRPSTANATIMRRRTAISQMAKVLGAHSMLYSQTALPSDWTRA